MKHRRTWIKRDALQDAMLADFLALAMEDAQQAEELHAQLIYSKQRRAVERSALREAFRAADINKLGADFCNNVKHMLQLP